jgi:hypothetical protein
MSDPKAAEIIQNLIILLHNRDYHAVDAALEYVARARLEHPLLPITVSLLPEVQRRIESLQ